MAEEAGSVEVAVWLNMAPFDRGTADLKSKVSTINTQMTGIGAKAFDTFSSTTKTAVTALMGFNSVAGLARMAATALGGPVAILAGGAGLLGLAAAAVNVAEKFAKFEQQMLTINAVLKATGGASGKTAADISALSKEISATTLQSGSDIRAAALSLLTFRNIATDTFDRALKLSADLASVGFGSVESSAFTLGRALEKPSEGLSRLGRAGITFTNTQKLMMKQFEDQGNIVAAQGVLLDGLTAKIGGAGAAQASGLSGAFDALTKSAGSFFTQLGAKLSGTLNLQAVLTKLTSDLNAMKKEMGLAPNASVLDKIADSKYNIEKTGEAIQAFKTKIASLQKEQSLLAPDENVKIGLIQGEIDKLTAKIAALDTTSKNLKTTWNSLEEEKFWAGHQAAVESAAAANAQAKDKIDGVKIALTQQIEALQRTERGQKIYEEAQKAGVVGNKEMEASIGRLIAKEEQLALRRSLMPTSLSSLESYKQSMLNEEQAEVQRYLRSLEQLKSYRAQGFLTEQEYNAKVEAERARNSYTMIGFAQKQADIETEWRTKAGNEAVSLLQTLGSKSKALAIAGIALSKAIAIASVIQSASAASVAALAPPPIGAGPIAGAPLAASIQSFAALQIGLIAATGIAQAAQAGSGSAGLSSPSVAASSSGAGGGTAASSNVAAAPQQISAISIDGIDPAKMFSGKQLIDLMERINKQTANGATLISTRNLRTVT